MSFTHGPYTFNAATGNDTDAFVWTAPDGSGLLSSNTGARWNWENGDTPSSNVGPSGGQGGGGYVYPEASSPGSFDDVYTVELNQNLNASLNAITVTFWTNQRGDDNDATCVVETNEGGAGWVERGATFGGSSDPAKVGTSGSDTWVERTVDLTGLVSNASTRVRIKITMPSSGTSWNNDYGLDTITITGVDLVLATIAGTTRNASGNPLANCEVWLFKHNDQTEALTFIAHTQSDGSGDYSFQVGDTDPNYLVLARLAGSPDVQWLSDFTVTPV